MIVCASKESNEERRCGDRKLLLFSYNMTVSIEFQKNIQYNVRNNDLKSTHILTVIS